MGAPKGNQFWKQRSSHGREKIFSSPDILWEAAQEYFEWCDGNPWQKHEAVKAGGHFGENVQSPTQRPYSLDGLCLFLDITDNTFKNYESSKEYEDFFRVTYRIRKIIETQQFEGATVGAFRENIISRKLGLADKRENNHSGEVNIISLPDNKRNG